MGKFGFSFSAKRALGISRMKGRVARLTGIPTSRGGRERKLGAMLGGGSWFFGTGRSTRQPAVLYDEERDEYVVDPRRSTGEVFLLAVGRFVVVVILVLAGVIAIVAYTGQSTRRPPSDQAHAAPLKTAFDAPVEPAGPQPAPTQAQLPIGPTETPEPPTKEQRLERSKWRTWVSARGQHSIAAKFVKSVAGVVTLEKKDGRQVELAIDKLSSADQDFIKNQGWRLLAAQPETK